MSNKSLSSLYDSIANSPAPGFSGALKLAMDGDIEAFEVFCDSYSYTMAIGFGDDGLKPLDMVEELSDDLSAVLNVLICSPENFKNPSGLFHFLEAQGGVFEKAFTLFEQNNTDPVNKIWSMTAKTSSQHVEVISGVIAAEYIGWKLMRDPKWTLNAGKLASAADQIGADHVLAVQHALVDYVQGKGKGLPMNRAAPKLYHFGSDFHPAMQKLWREKLQGFNTTQGYSVQNGVTTVAHYDFGDMA